MKSLLDLIPQSLVERVFALYSISLLLFLGAGLGMFYANQFSQAIDDAHESIGILAEVMAPTVSDSVVIGDYDTVKRILAKATVRSQLASASYIDLQGGTVSVGRSPLPTSNPPQWLSDRVATYLYDVNRNISVGGRDYGVLRLRFSPETIAGELWKVTRISLLLVVGSFFVGMALIRIPLRRWLGNLDRIHAFEWEIDGQAADATQLLAEDAPIEIRQTFEVLNRAATSLQVQRARAAVTLNAIADGVVTVDNQGQIVYANPVAERMFAAQAGGLLGRNIRSLLPTKVQDGQSDADLHDWHGRRVDLSVEGVHRIIIDTSLSSILGPGREIAGHVLACRDVTESYHLDNQLRIELSAKQAALASLREVLKGLLPESNLGKFAESDDDLGSVAQLISDLVREREASRRALDNQKFTLDEHAMVSITDASGNITYVNDKFTKISGYCKEDLLGQNHRIIKSGMHPPTFYTDLWSTITAGKVWHGQIANRSKNGDIFWFASTIVPWLDESDKPYQYISIRTDVTEQKRIELALEEARRRELETGNQIQRTLLLGDIPEGIQGAWLATYTAPSNGVDGDFFTFTRYRPDCFEMLVGDVMGKGVPAALIGAAVKTSYNQVLAELFSRNVGAGEPPSPEEIINALHHTLTPRLIELSSFVTLALYRFDQEAGTLTYVNAGHTPGLIARGDTSLTESILGDNVPIGVIQDEIYRQRSVPIRPGDSFLAYSDGITEARNDAAEEFGLERLTHLIAMGRAAALPPSVMLQSLRHELRSFVGSESHIDDQTAVLIELHPRRKSPRRNIALRNNADLITIPWRLDALNQLREHIEATARHFSEPFYSSMILAAFEAATNVLRHSLPSLTQPTLTCRLTLESDSLTVELIYPAAAFSPPAEARPDFSGNSEGGFGLYIIENSVDQVEYVTLMPGINSIRLMKRLRVDQENSDASSAT